MNYSEKQFTITHATHLSVTCHCCSHNL